MQPAHSHQDFKSSPTAGVTRLEPGAGGCAPGQDLVDARAAQLGCLAALVAVKHRRQAHGLAMLSRIRNIGASMRLQMLKAAVPVLQAGSEIAMQP